MKLVIIESPYSGDVKANVEYLKACIKDSLERREAPYASHLFYTQVLDDTKPNERTLGMEAGFAWGTKAELCAVYTDRGISKGMEMGIERAKQNGLEIEYREIYG